MKGGCQDQCSHFIEYPLYSQPGAGAPGEMQTNLAPSDSWALWTRLLVQNTGKPAWKLSRAAKMAECVQGRLPGGGVVGSKP